MDRLSEITRPRDRGIDPRERNPMPTRRGHGFNFQTARLIAAIKVIHKKYGTKIRAAAGFTRANSRMVQPTASQSATIQNSPASIFFKPKNTGAHSVFSSS